ncbi:MAG: TlpA family protein disulfide reductase [Bacteroidetes bacterium]|nr:TlpA family protein disulfide reductase [Bacteroidota bacterium]
MRIRNTFLIASLLLVLAALQVQAQKLSSLTTQLTSVTGDQTTVAALGAGRVTVVSFWATWCKPCKEEMKAMQPIFEKLKDKITYVAISIDNTKTMAKVAPYIKSQGYTFNVLLDPNSEFFNAVNGTNVPYTLVFNADGSLHSKHDGYFEGDATKLEEELKTMIGSGGQ